MEPKIDLNGDVATILASLARQTDTMIWVCPLCRMESSQPLRKKDVADVQGWVSLKIDGKTDWTEVKGCCSKHSARSRSNGC
jgi:hypothetical protein